MSPQSLSALEDRRPSSRLERAVLPAIFVLALLVGIWLRFDALSGQTPYHDEWHTLVAVRDLSASELLSNLGAADRSLPIALYLEQLSHHGGISDLALWLPLALLATVLIVALVAFVARSIDRDLALVAGTFLLLAPLLVYYARAARPYGLAAPAALLASLIFASAADDRRHGWAAGYVVLSALSVWAMPVCAPFLAGSALGLMVALRSEPRVRKLLLLAGLAGAVSIALLAPALLENTPTLTAKLGADGSPLISIAAGLRLFPGGGSFAVLLGEALLASLGIAALFREKRAVLTTTAAGAALQLVAILVARPRELDSPVVAARYLLPCGLVIVLWSSMGVALLARRSAIARPLAAAALLTLAGATWVPAWSLVASPVDNFRSTKLFQLLFFDARTLQRFFPELPSPYRIITSTPGEFSILEVPYNGYLRTPYPYYQVLHSREVFLGVESGACAAGDTRELPPAGIEGFDLSRFLSLSDLDGLRANGIRFVVLHRNPEMEVPWVAEGRRRKQRFDFDGCVALLRRLTGSEPVESESIALFDIFRRSE